MTSPLRIGIAGLGTVGCGVVDILHENAALLSSRAGREILVAAVSTRTPDKKRDIHLGNVTWHHNAMELTHDENVDVVVETIGGEDGIAWDLCSNALANGKHVVTANKALIAKHGMVLAKHAEENDVSIRFEAAVAGAIPILKTIRETLSANRFTSVSGILNGTCNYILTAMEERKADFSEILAEAQEKGYAETPPDLDVDGIDAAHKLAILSALAYGCTIDFNSIFIEGIRNVSLADIEYARELGYAIRLLGLARPVNHLEHGTIEQRVHPCLLPLESDLARIHDVVNAVRVEGNASGPILITGAGAGRLPTASSIVGDIMDIATGKPSHPFSVPLNDLRPCDIRGIHLHRGAYYIRVKVKDEPGVLASITSTLSGANIGVDSVLQKPHHQDHTAQIALITHQTDETSIQQAMKHIAELSASLEAPHLIRVEMLGMEE